MLSYISVKSRRMNIRLAIVLTKTGLAVIHLEGKEGKKCRKLGVETSGLFFWEIFKTSQYHETKVLND